MTSHICDPNTQVHVASPSPCSETEDSVRQQSASFQTLCHWQTDFALLPFVVDLLTGKPIEPGIQPLPHHQPTLLTQETLTAVQEIAHKVVLSFLTREIGWSQQLYLTKSAEKPFRGRLWDSWERSGVSLSFTADTIDTLLAGFNLTRYLPKTHECDSNQLAPSIKKTVQRSPVHSLYPPKTVAEQKQDVLVAQRESEQILQEMALAHNGDMILHHLVFREFIQRNTPLSSRVLQAFLQNPLNQLTYNNSSGEREREVPFNLQPLLEFSAFPFFPWLGLYCARQWLSWEEIRWPSPNVSHFDTDTLYAFHQRNQHQANLCQQWCSLAQQQERLDALIGWLYYYKQLLLQYKSPESRHQRFDMLTRKLRHIERRELAESWAQTWTPVLLLQQVFVDCQRIHPIDREACHRLYLDTYQAYDFHQVVQSAEQLLAKLQPTVGT